MTDEQPPIQVTAALLSRGGRLLLCRRTRPDYLAGKWEFPGGKIEPGESAEACLARELGEELGIQAAIGELMGRFVHHYEALVVELHAFHATWTGGELRLEDGHDAHEWVTPSKLLEWDLAPADIPIARRAMEQAG